MNAIATRLQFGAAACAVAATAAMLPMTAAGPLPTAQAVPAIPAPEFLGQALGSTGCILPIFDAAQCAAFHAATIGNLLYLGPVDGTPPTRTDLFTLPVGEFLGLVPFIGSGLHSWFDSLDIEACVGGLSARITDPYSHGLTVSVGSGC